mmetsp:Transcript_5316/g.20022  ORF Transcript_5316/g.20022 Transcript_5316/m.20022 type:complete len:265 (+) Transcript_5316:801-1595(+)
MLRRHFRRSSRHRRLTNAIWTTSSPMLRQRWPSVPDRRPQMQSRIWTTSSPVSRRSRQRRISTTSFRMARQLRQASLGSGSRRKKNAIWTTSSRTPRDAGTRGMWRRPLCGSPRRWDRQHRNCRRPTNAIWTTSSRIPRGAGPHGMWTRPLCVSPRRWDRRHRSSVSRHPDAACSQSRPGRCPPPCAPRGAARRSWWAHSGASRLGRVLRPPHSFGPPPPPRGSSSGGKHRTSPRLGTACRSCRTSSRRRGHPRPSRGRPGCPT